MAATAPTTIHSLLGWEDRTHFRHDRDHPLPEDMVIIDETSMVSLPLMAKLLDAVRPEASVVLVGDPFQLASIEAGTVMSDVVGPAGVRGSGRTGRLGRGAGFGGGDADAVGLAPAVPVPEAGPGPASWPTGHRAADHASVRGGLDHRRPGRRRPHRRRARRPGLLEEGAADLRWVRPDDAEGLAEVTAELVAVGRGAGGRRARGDGPAALEAAGRVKVLAATRRGPNGMADWTDRIEQGVAEHGPGFHPDRRWHVGRPVLVTANDRANRVFNGDTGVVVRGR